MYSDRDNDKYPKLVDSSSKPFLAGQGCAAQRLVLSSRKRPGNGCVYVTATAPRSSTAAITETRSIGTKTNSSTVHFLHVVKNLLHITTSCEAWLDLQCTARKTRCVHHRAYLVLLLNTKLLREIAVFVAAAPQGRAKGWAECQAEAQVH